jgi:hypothetical protein
MGLRRSAQCGSGGLAVGSCGALFDIEGGRCDLDVRAVIIRFGATLGGFDADAGGEPVSVWDHSTTEPDRVAWGDVHGRFDVGDDDDEDSGAVGSADPEGLVGHDVEDWEVPSLDVDVGHGGS